jgi:recombinational DNA repair protein RecR
MEREYLGAIEDEPAGYEPVDELAIDVARDYCETCGKFTDGETCPACGDES